MHESLPFQEQQEQKRREDGLPLLSQYKFEEQKKACAYTRTHPACHCSLFHQSVSSHCWIIMATQEEGTQAYWCFTVIFDVWGHEWLIDCKREFEQHTLMCMRKDFKWAGEEALCLGNDSLPMTLWIWIFLCPSLTLVLFPGFSSSLSLVVSIISSIHMCCSSSVQSVQFNTVYRTVSVTTAIEILISTFEATFCGWGPFSEYQGRIQPQAPTLYFPCSQSCWSSTLLKKRSTAWW